MGVIGVNQAALLCGETRVIAKRIALDQGSGLIQRLTGNGYRPMNTSSVCQFLAESDRHYILLFSFVFSEKPDSTFS